MAPPIFGHIHSKIKWNNCKLLFHSIYSFLRDAVNFRVPWPDLPQTFLIIFWFMWIFINMQKNRLFYWFVLEIWLIKKFCNLIGWEHFGPYLWDKRIPWDLCRNTANNKYFHYRTNSVKTNDQIFQYIKKTLFFAHFWSIFLTFGAKNFLSCTTS